MLNTIESIQISAVEQETQVSIYWNNDHLPKRSTQNYNQANYATNLVKNKFEFVLITGDDLLQAVNKCKKSGEKFVVEVQCASEEIVVI